MKTAPIAIAFCLLAMQTFPKADSACVSVEFRLAQKSPTPGLISATSSNDSRKIYLHREVAMTGKAISNAEVVKYYEHDPVVVFGKPGYRVEVTFSSEGAKGLRQLTSKNHGRILAVLVDGRVIADSVIHEDMDERIAINDPGMTQEHAEKLAQLLSRACGRVVDK